MNRMNKDELLELLSTLKLDREDFTILSSCALVLRDIYEDAGDLDIAVTENGLNCLKQNYKLIPKQNGWYIVNDKIEFVQDDMKSRRTLVGEYYLQDIYDYLKYLKSSGREKDKLRIPLVEMYINRNNIYRQKTIKRN